LGGYCILMFRIPQCHCLLPAFVSFTVTPHQALEEAAERERAEQAELQSKIAAMEGKVRAGGGGGAVADGRG
jgi:hypothetical protein